MIYKTAITGIRNKLIHTIKHIVTSNKNCIGTFYKNIGEHHTVSKVEDEYITSPIVVIHGNLGGYGGFEAATVYDLFIDDGRIKCTLNGEAGEDWDEPLENVQVEGLIDILDWLKENKFLVQKDLLFELRVEEIFNDTDKCERLGEILHEQMLSDDEPLDKVGTSLINAYRNQDVTLLLFAVCGWDFRTLINKTIDIDDAVLYNGSSLQQKIESKLRSEYLPDNYEEDTIYELAQNEFECIKNEICTECSFDEDTYLEQNGGDSPFDNLREDVYNEIYKRIIPCREQQ